MTWENGIRRFLLICPRSRTKAVSCRTDLSQIKYTITIVPEPQIMGSALFTTVKILYFPVTLMLWCYLRLRPFAVQENKKTLRTFPTYSATFFRWHLKGGWLTSWGEDLELSGPYLYCNFIKSCPPWLITMQHATVPGRSPADLTIPPQRLPTRSVFSLTSSFTITRPPLIPLSTNRLFSFGIAFFAGH